MLADDISHGHGWGADVCLLLAVILAVVAAVIYVLNNRPREVRADTGTTHVLRSNPWAPVAWSLSLALIALGLLIL
jgi:hypothetical protein